MKKILFISHLSNVGGAELTLLDIALEFKYKNYDITVGIPDTKGDLNKYLDHYQIHYKVTKLPMLRSHESEEKDIKNYYNTYVKFRRDMEREKFTLIITNTSTIPWGAMLAQDLEIPHAWLIRESSPLDHNLSSRHDNVCTPSYILEHSNKVYIPSIKSGINWFGNNFGINKQIKTLYTTPLSERIKEFKINKKNFHKPILIIGIVTNFEYFKNMKLLFSIIEQWEMEECQFVIYGTGSMRQIMMDTIKKAKSNLQIEYLGHTQKIDNVYNNIDLVVSLNSNEAFGRTLSEGAYFGCVPVYPCKSSFSERFTESHTGLSFEDDSVESFFIKIKSGILNRTKLQEISSNVQKLANSGFNALSPATIIEEDFLSFSEM